MATENIFYENPRSFKMDRKSSLASEIKSTISDKLLHFTGDYTDDVFAEYILILVCNGKNQYQARDDLEAFLGERSGQFVSWLWGVLLKASLQSHMHGDLTNLKDAIVRSACDDVANEQRSCMLKDLTNYGVQNDANILSHGGMSCQLMKPGPSARLLNSKDLYTQLHKVEIPKNSATAEISHPESLKSDSFKEKGSGNSSGVKQSMRTLENKVCNVNDNELLHRLQYSSKKELFTRRLQSVTTDKPHSRFQAATKVARRSPVRVVDSVSKENVARPRGNVWDRLGKPFQDNTSQNDMDIYDHGTRKQLEENPNITCLPNDANTATRKRQLTEICPTAANESVSFDDRSYKHIRFKEPSKEFAKLHSLKYSCSKILSSAISELKKSDINEFKTPEIAAKTKANEVSNRKLTKNFSQIPPKRTLVSGATSVSIGYEEGIDANVKPTKSEAQDSELKSHQTETKASDICRKQVHMTNQGQISSLSSTGALNQSEEDNESRTVLVTNVHFNATKEALALHFAKCGVIEKVIILSDPITDQPKGSAYITFASTESVENAIAFSGSSFWSRTVKVMRKAEVTLTTRAPAQMVGVRAQSWYPQLSKRVNLQRPHRSSHLQWRRDQTITNSAAQGGGSEALLPLVQQGGAYLDGKIRNRSLTYVRTTQAKSQVAGLLETSTAA